jgi:hypothetical protein
VTRGGHSRAPGGLVADISAVLVVVTVTPLVLLQMPNLIAAAIPAMADSLRAGTQIGPQAAAELVRVSGFALPAMLLVSPPAAVAARRGGAWPVLLGGLALIGLADAGGNLVGIRVGGMAASVTGSVTSLVAGVGLDRIAHGVGAGLAAAGTLALIWERTGPARRLLACLWAAAAACALVTAVPLLSPRLAAGGWRVLLQPYPQLTGAALAATAVYVAVTRGASSRAAPAGSTRGRGTESDSRAAAPLLAAGLPGTPAARGPAVRGLAVRKPAVRSMARLSTSGLSPTGLSTDGAGADGGSAGTRTAAGRQRTGHAGRGRGERTPAERAQLAMLSVPVAGICGLTVGSTFGWPPRTQLAAGVLGAAVLAALAIGLSRDAVAGAGLCFPLVALAAGLVAAPSAGAVESLRMLAPGAAGSGLPTSLPSATLATVPATVLAVIKWLPVTAAGAAALAGAVAGWAFSLSGRWLHAAPALGVTAGLAAAAAGLALLDLKLHTAHTANTAVLPSEHTLAAALALLAGGLALALGPALAEAPPPGALAGLSLLLAGALTGYLIAGAIGIGLLPGAGPAASARGAAPAVLHALRGAAGVWELAAACVAAAAMLGVFLVGRARRATVRAHSGG